eukprot:3397679-Amphidinium_carterae.1
MFDDVVLADVVFDDGVLDVLGICGRTVSSGSYPQKEANLTPYALYTVPTIRNRQRGRDSRRQTHKGTVIVVVVVFRAVVGAVVDCVVRCPDQFECCGDS